MATFLETRADLINGLPKRVRDALLADDDSQLAHTLAALTAHEHETLRAVIDGLALLPQSIPAEPAVDDFVELPDSPELELQGVEGLPEPPHLRFRVVNGQEIRPPQEWLDTTHRAAQKPASGSVLFPVWYGTTRKPNQEGRPAQGFTGNRDENGRVHYGVARVFVPESHEPASLGSSWLKRWLWTWQDDRLSLRRIECQNERDFWEELRQQLIDLTTPSDYGPAPGNNILLFVHGYRTSFAAAVVTAAQLGYDLAIPGITACFSWPSRGTYLGYPVDEAACEPSVPAVASFIRHLVSLVGPGRVHVLAHSMGNRVVLRALELLVWETLASKITAPTQRLGHVFLAAPDVDRQLFRLLAPTSLRATAKLANLYVSRRDAAVYLSRWHHGYDRAGLRPPVTVVPGMATVDVTHADISGHGAFREARSVLRDISQVLHHDALPDDGRRQLLRAGGGAYWQLG